MNHHNQAPIKQIALRQEGHPELLGEDRIETKILGIESGILLESTA